MSSMHLHYRFIHACGHTGIGPLICEASKRASPDPPNNEKLNTIHLELPFSCPYCPNANCSPNSTIQEVPLGEGVLTIISLTWPWCWCILRVCQYEDIIPQEWALSTGCGGFRQMAWIPRPCGEVRVNAGMEEMRREGQRTTTSAITEVTCAWRQRADERARSRFAGLLSQLHAAVMSGHNAR
jgi:hypothetical protein